MLAQVIREIQAIEGIRMTIKIEEIEMIVINDAGASETFVEMGRTAANENRQDLSLIHI